MDIVTSKQIRQQFLDFFASKGHKIVESAPMVVKDDPTLMFTNAGMNQFKDCFLGNTAINSTRVADTQKCLRVSGKHNDLEEVGHDTYHHTMFEMLGNWSFGDYFKKDAIDWAWELLTEVYKLNPNRLYASVFEGSNDDGLDMDTEAQDLWLKHLPIERIVKGNKKDNFWEMGDTGPCGPCSEIHIDLRDDEDRKKVSGFDLVNKDHPLVIEIWNLVFMQYNRKANGSLEPLPKNHIDTGMGLERLVMAVNGFKSNYEGDFFQNLINDICKISGKKYTESEDVAISMRVIADHIRAISFSIADGQLPSNVKAGYVIRRILRRAVRYGYTFLDFNNPFLCELVPSLIREMGDAFPELKKQETLITKVIKEEEETFLRTLEKGIKLLDTVMKKSESNKVISGKDAFTLYDTFGFPVDLSMLIAKEKGFSIDIDGFEAELTAQKERGRSAAAVQEGDWVEVRPFKDVVFTGYDNSIEEVQILKYRTVKSKGKELFQLVFDKSPFYAESGGQIGDIGEIVSSAGERIPIVNTVKENNLIIHIAERIPVSPEDNFTAAIDKQHRKEVTRNHTATHLLHNALRSILGEHIEQKGSHVGTSSFRFDFSHYEKISPEDLQKVEKRVNKLIRENAVREEQRAIPIAEAKAMGAMALFGEKYGDKVRVLKFNNSVELCGGTHVASTGEIGYFKIISESAIAAGIRRIEATTGKYAELLVYNVDSQIQMVRDLLGNSTNILAGIKKIMEDNEKFKASFDEILKARAVALKQSVIESREEINGLDVMTLRGNLQADIVKDVAFQLYKEMTNTVFAAAFENEGKACLALMYTADLVEKGYDASKDIKTAAKHIQGGGGGQKFLATAGGRNLDNLSLAVNTLIDLATKG